MELSVLELLTSLSFIFTFIQSSHCKIVSGAIESDQVSTCLCEQPSFVALSSIVLLDFKQTPEMVQE